MKKLFFLILAAIGLQTISFAQSTKYQEAMKSNLVAIDTAKSAEDFTRIANTFERIGDAEKTQWLPYYYASLSLSIAGWMPAVSDKDVNSQRINGLCDKAESLTTNNADKSEIEAIRNMSATQQMMVDPASRFMTYGKAAMSAIDKGLQLNPNNPRLYYLRGMSLFSTPPQYGGGKEKAKPVFQKAVDLYKAEQPAEFYPDWGRKQAENMLAQCQ